MDTYISDQKVETTTEAAALAEGYVLTHRRNFAELRTRNTGFGESADAGGVCHKKGHWKAECYALKAKSRQNGAAVQAKGACLTVSLWWEVK